MTAAARRPRTTPDPAADALGRWARATADAIGAEGPSDSARTDSTRARAPDATGYIERAGVRVFWERYGDGSPTLLLMPTWSIFHARHWRLQIPYLARTFRVVTFDGRGNGRSDRPQQAEAYADTEFVADALAVLDATGTERDGVVVAGLSMGAGYALRLAAECPDRVRGAVFIAPAVPVQEQVEDEVQVDPSFAEPPLDDDDWGAYYNATSWRRDFPGFAAWFVGEKIFSEPHSTKAIEDGIGWTLETDPETLVAMEYGPYLWPPREWGPAVPHEGRAMPFVRRVRCPSLVIHGSDDRIVSLATAERLAVGLGAPLLEIRGGGHAPNARWPVVVNRAIRDFVLGLR